MQATMRWPAFRGFGSMVALGLALGGCAETQLATHAAKKTAREIYGTQGGDERPAQQAAVPPSPRRTSPGRRTASLP